MCVRRERKMDDARCVLVTDWIIAVQVLGITDLSAQSHRIQMANNVRPSEPWYNSNSSSESKETLLMPSA
jgi:hypothetical protein